MRTVIEYSENLKSDWTEFVDRSENASLAHQIGFRQVIESGLGNRPIYLMARNGNRTTGILPMFLIRTWWRATYLVSVPWLDYGGICAEDVESEQALLEKARSIAVQENARFIEFRSESRCSLDLQMNTQKVTFLMDLSSGPEAIWKALDGKVRNQVRKSQNSGLTVEYGGLELLEQFYRVFAWKMHELGTPVWSKHLFAGLLSEFPKTVQLVLVKKGEELVTGALLLTFKDRQYVPSAASYRNYLKLCPYHALYWSVIERAAQNGFRFFDFGRSTIDSPTYQFKIQWVKTPTPLEWQYSLHGQSEIPQLNPANPKYRFAKSVWSRMPLPLANLLGPSVIKNFP